MFLFEQGLAEEARGFFIRRYSFIRRLMTRGSMRSDGGGLMINGRAHLSHRRSSVDRFDSPPAHPPSLIRFWSFGPFSQGFDFSAACP